MPIINNVNELNERISFFSIEDDGPEPGSGTPTEVGSCWAKIRTQYVKDIKDYAGTAFEDTVEIVIRQYQNFEIKNDMELKWGRNKYNIVKINPDTSQKEFLVLIVKKTN